VTRSFVSLSLGALACTTYFRSPASLEHADVFIWVADRDAGCVVALNQDLFELETWFVERPTALVTQRGGLFVQSSSAAESSWWRLERGSQPVRCVAPELVPGAGSPPWRSLPGLQGEPTAWARRGDLSLIATPGAVHLYSTEGVLRGVQGGFRWISAVATVEDVHEAAEGQGR